MLLRNLALITSLALAACSSPREGTAHSQLGDPGCKPSAPLELEVLEATVVGGVAEITYRVRPLIEATAVSVTIDEEPDNLLLRHDAADTFGITPEEGRLGSARVRLSDDYETAGARVVLRASISFQGLGSDGSSGPETQQTVRMLEFGAPIAVDGLELVTSDGIPSLDMPAARTEQR